MTTITIHLPNDQAERLAALAHRLQLSVEELATAKVQELLEQPDEQFQQYLRRVLEKNRELYRRLA
jgi:hypothetical protein